MKKPENDNDNDNNLQSLDFVVLDLVGNGGMYPSGSP